MSNKILMTAENPDGAKLEDLLDALIEEVFDKTEKIRDINHPTARSYLKSNRLIIEKLAQCSAIQKGAIKFAQDNPLPQ